MAPARVQGTYHRNSARCGAGRFTHEAGRPLTCSSEVTARCRAQGNALRESDHERGRRPRERRPLRASGRVRPVARPLKRRLRFTPLIALQRRQ